MIPSQIDGNFRGNVDCHRTSPKALRRHLVRLYSEVLNSKGLGASYNVSAIPHNLQILGVTDSYHDGKVQLEIAIGRASDSEL